MSWVQCKFCLNTVAWSSCAFRYRDAGQLCVEEAYKCRELAARVQLLQDAVQIYKAGVKAGVKSLQFHEQATADHIKLLKLQNALEMDNPDVRSTCVCCFLKDLELVWRNCHLWVLHPRPFVAG